MKLIHREDLRIKIIDFGSAAEEDGALTRFLLEIFSNRGFSLQNILRQRDIHVSRSFVRKTFRTGASGGAATLHIKFSLLLQEGIFFFTSYFSIFKTYDTTHVFAHFESFLRLPTVPTKKIIISRYGVLGCCCG